MKACMDDATNGEYPSDQVKSRSRAAASLGLGGTFFSKDGFAFSLGLKYNVIYGSFDDTEYEKYGGPKNAWLPTEKYQVTDHGNYYEHVIGMDLGFVIGEVVAVEFGVVPSFYAFSNTITQSTKDTYSVIFSHMSNGGSKSGLPPDSVLTLKKTENRSGGSITESDNSSGFCLPFYVGFQARFALGRLKGIAGVRATLSLTNDKTSYSNSSDNKLYSNFSSIQVYTGIAIPERKQKRHK